MRKVLVLGGYGNFGKRIAAALAAKDIGVIIAGRNQEKAIRLSDKLGSKTGIAVFDIQSRLADQLIKINPTVVVNTCGPFQNTDYEVARTCIEKGIHYIDLADGRDFVTSITTLDEAAKAHGVSVISGASTVPGLSSAVLDHYAPEFSKIISLKYGISPGQKAERGLATTKGIMSYVGKPLKEFSSNVHRVFGWQDIYRQHYPLLGKRWMANCDIPDLDLFPDHYGIEKIQFSAGLELTFMHLGLWALSWLVRARIPLNLPALSAALLRISDGFNGFGSADGGMHMIIKGVGRDRNPHTRKWFIIAKNGDGPHIPTIPAIILAARLTMGEPLPTGAMPCIGLVSLEDCLEELAGFNITTHQE